MTAEYARTWRNRVRGTPPRHGNSGYINYGCRCDTCRKAHAEQMRQWRKSRKET